MSVDFSSGCLQQLEPWPRTFAPYLNIRTGPSRECHLRLCCSASSCCWIWRTSQRVSQNVYLHRERTKHQADSSSPHSGSWKDRCSTSDLGCITVVQTKGIQVSSWDDNNSSRSILTRPSFYYADERKANGDFVYSAISGEAAGEYYYELSQAKEQGPWLSTFVKGAGYVDFQWSSIVLLFTKSILREG